MRIGKKLFSCLALFLLCIVIVNNKNAEIQLNLSVLPFVVALKGIEPLISP